MSISTYAELQASIASFLNRDDLTSVIPDFITLAEAEFNRRIRHWRMEARTTLTIDDQYVDIPADWLETIKLSISTAEGPHEVELISHADMAQLRGESKDIADVPKYYAMSAGQFEFWPTPSDSTTGSLLYSTTIEALSDSNTSNWVLAQYPDAYLYSALIHSAPYLQEDARLAVWSAFSKNAIDGINADSAKAKYSGSGLRMKVRGLS